MFRRVPGIMKCQLYAWKYTLVNTGSSEAGGNHQKQWRNENERSREFK